MKPRAVIASLLSLTLVVTLAACSSQSTQAQKGTGAGVLIGAAAGAGLGQAIGRNTQGTLIGAAIGAAVGGLAGHQIGAYMDRQEAELRNVMAQSDAVSLARSQDVLTATFKGDVMFDFDSATIKPGGYMELDRVAGVLNKYPQTTIRVEGHTDTQGAEAYNQQLSERRAEAVKNALIQRNVNPARIQAIGYGESMPISSSHDLNRRVNIVIVPIQEG